jgi:hypothetical protein
MIPDPVAAKTPRTESWITTLYLPEKSPRAGVWDDPKIFSGTDTAKLAGFWNNAPLSAFQGDLAKLTNITDTIYVPFRPDWNGVEPLPADLQFTERIRKLHPDMKMKNLAPILD